MSYRTDTDLEFLATISKEDLKGLARAITHDNDGSERLGQMLSQANPDAKDYWKEVAEQIQTYGANTVMTIFRFGEGVKYREVLKDVCDKLNVNYNGSNQTSTIEKNLLDKILKDTWEKMNEEQRRRMLMSIKFSCDKSMVAGAGLAGLSALSATLATSSIMAFNLASMITYSVAGSLAPVLGSSAMSFIIGRSAGWLLGPLGWGLAILSVSGPAYRVTIPACATVALLRKKYNLTPEARIKLEKQEKLIQKLTKEVDNYRNDDEKCISIYLFYYKIQDRINKLDIEAIRHFSFGETNVYERNKTKIERMASSFSFRDSIIHAKNNKFTIDNLRDRLEFIIGCYDLSSEVEEELRRELEESFFTQMDTEAINREYRDNKDSTQIASNIFTSNIRNSDEDNMRISFCVYCSVINKILEIKPHLDTFTYQFKTLSLYTANKTKIEYYVKNMRFRDALTYAYACRNDKDKLHKVFDKWFINTRGNRVKLEELKSEFEDFWKYEV